MARKQQRRNQHPPAAAAPRVALLATEQAELLAGVNPE